MKTLHTFLICCVLAGSALAQGISRDKSPLQSGPMLGYSEMREVMLWAQTSEAAKVQVLYQDKETGEQFRTATVQTEAATGYVAHLLADQVQPGHQYSARLYIDKKPIELGYPFEFQAQTLWQWRSDPPAFKFIAGSCSYVADSAYDRPGPSYGGNYEIWDAIYAQDADFMVWLGDNTYLREADWNTMTGILYRYTKARSLPQLQRVLAQMHHYATWDDHDFGPNDSDRSFLHKDKTLAAFKLFWANNGYGIPGQEGGVTGQFSWGDCDFFLLDDRYFRSPNERSTGERVMFGEVQMEWLIDALKSSRAPFKFVCTGGMVLSTYKRYENYINLYPEERQRLLDAIQAEKIPGVIFLTGDRHHTELSHWKPEGGLEVYDLTVSPLTATAYQADEPNEYIVPETTVGERNFALIEVSGKYGERVLKMTIRDRLGAEKWSREIKQAKP